MALSRVSKRDLRSGTDRHTGSKTSLDGFLEVSRGWIRRQWGGRAAGASRELLDNQKPLSWSSNLPPTGGKLHEAQQRKRQCRKNHPATACPAHAKLAFLGFASTHGIEDTEGDGRGNDVAGLMPGLDGAELNAVSIGSIDASLGPCQ